MGIRFALVVGVVGLVYGGLLYKLYGVQVVDGPYYVAKAQSFAMASGALEARRGTIFFTGIEGEKIPVALDKELPEIYAVPNLIVDAESMAEKIAPVLGLDKKEVLTKLLKQNDTYELLVARTEPALAHVVENAKLTGIFVKERPQRFYPFEAMAANVLGYVGPDNKGTRTSGHYGAEEFYNTELAGMPGTIEEGKMMPPIDGSDLVFTLNPDVQSEAERIIDGLITTHKATGGGVIVMDPKTGAIRAMVSRPSFDPNAYAKTDIASFKNYMTQETYEPGSVIKLLTMASGLDAGVITPETTYMDRGKITMNGKTIRNFDYDTKGARGKLPMTAIIENSLNTGAVFVGQALGREKFTEYFRAFGVGEKTGVDALGEGKGDLRRLNPKEKDIAFATAAYGQGMTVTPLGLISAVASIANGGMLMRPYMNAALGAQEVRKVVSAKSATQVTAMMVSAVDKAGVAHINGYSIAGKTGTAHIPDFKKGGYTEEVVNTYIGFAPAHNPKFIVLVKLDKPLGAPAAAVTVVPAFRELAQFVLNYFAIPPDRL